MTGYEALRTSAAWIDLSARGKIRVVGEDRARLLHAMSTNDVKNLGEGSGLYAFFLTDKGRILADAVIYNLGEAFLLDTEPEAARVLHDHLDRYIIADDVTLEDETASVAAIGLEGPTSLEAAADLGISAPDTRYGVRPWGEGFAGDGFVGDGFVGDGFVAHVAGSAREGLRLFIPAAEKAKLIERLTAAGIPPANLQEARVVRLENGLPRFGEDISERFLAQETQALHAVHANKGCYLGQEIVERVRSRGQVHRLLSAVRIAGQVVPPAGTRLLADGNPAAEITSAAFSPALNQVVGMAYVRAAALHEKKPMVVAQSDPPIPARIA